MTITVQAVLFFANLLFCQQVYEARLCPNITVSWWENEPLVYTKENRHMGDLPLILQKSTELCCENKLHVNWSEKLGSYEAGLLAVNAHPENNISKNDSEVRIWLPFSLKHLAVGSQKVQKEILANNQLIVFTFESTAEKIKILYKGFKRIFSFIMITLLITILFGFFIWIAETNSNEKHFPKPFYRGAWHGFWWSIVTVTTVGYGDKVPKTGIGKFIGIIWMSMGIILFPVLTAEMASILTDSTFSISLKKVGALDKSLEIKEAYDAGAIVQECKSYEHCENLLVNGQLDAILVNIHTAIYMHQRNPSLFVRKTIAKRVPVNVVFYSWEQHRMNSLIHCIRQNAASLAHSLASIQQASELQLSEEALFTSGGRSIAIYTTGFVIGLYIIIFALDWAKSWQKRNQKIADFRDGVFMGNIIPAKDETTVEVRNSETFDDEIINMIKQQKKCIQEVQAALEQIENKIAAHNRKEHEEK